MSRPAIYTPEEAKARRQERVRANVARHTERLSQMSSLEQIAWKARASLGDGFDPYTPEERERLECIRKARAALEAEVNRLNEEMTARYKRLVSADPSLAPILAELESGAVTRMTLKPH